MDVAHRDRVRVHRRNAVSVRKHDILVRERCRVAADDAASRDCPLEPAEKCEPGVPQLVARPFRSLHDSLVDLLVAEIERDEDVIRVAVDAGTGKLLQELDTFAGLWPALRDVPERDDQLRLVVLQVRKGGAERDGVSVHV